MARNDEVIAGIILGILGLAVLAKILGKKCPTCGSFVPGNQQSCQNCGRVL